MAKKKAPVLVGYTVSGKPVMAGLFKFQDTYGFPLCFSIIECQKRGIVPCLPSFVADAVLAGWRPDRAIVKAREGFRDAGCDGDDWSLVKEGLAIAAKEPEKYCTDNAPALFLQLDETTTGS